MKKALSLLLAMMILVCCSATALADEGIEVYVTISNSTLKLSREKVNVTDIDFDGKLTINDALYCAHELKFEGGAVGYASSIGSYGLKIDKLWGVEKGISYGYYLNNASAMSLTDEVKEGDHVVAFIYTDLTTWSDTYCFFDKYESHGESVDLTLNSIGYDENWSPITVPVSNAIITVNGVDTSVTTDKEGKATIIFEKGGTYIISARSESQTLVPPVCVSNVTVSAEVSDETETSKSPAEPGDGSMALYVILGVFSICIIAVAVKFKKKYEK